MDGERGVNEEGSAIGQSDGVVESLKVSFCVIFLCASRPDIQMFNSWI